MKEERVRREEAIKKTKTKKAAWRLNKTTRVDGTADDSAWKSRSEKDCGGWGLNITPPSVLSYCSIIGPYLTTFKFKYSRTLHCRNSACPFHHSRFQRNDLQIPSLCLWRLGNQHAVQQWLMSVVSNFLDSRTSKTAVGFPKDQQTAFCSTNSSLQVDTASASKYVYLQNEN
jgi:hypothetical protein